MAQALVGHTRLVALLEHLARGPPGQDRAKRRAIEAHRRAKARSCRIQERATLLHEAHDVVEIGHRQDAAPLVAVEDDQVELVELHVEELADREGNQGELADRRAVLLLWRPQDGEMDEVDRWVRLQDVAPGALARVGLTAHQQHLEPVAYAVHHEGRAVVLERELLWTRLDLDLDHIGPAVIDRNADRRVAPD